jgi:hypothetical protein
VLFRTPAREEWRPSANLAVQTPPETGALCERKGWQGRVLQLSAVGSEQSELARSTLEKGAIFRHFFVNFSRVFSRASF